MLINETCNNKSLVGESWNLTKVVKDHNHET